MSNATTGSSAKFSTELETAVDEAIKLASASVSDRLLEEHLLYALLGDPKTRSFLRRNEVDIAALEVTLRGDPVVQKGKTSDKCQSTNLCVSNEVSEALRLAASIADAEKRDEFTGADFVTSLVLSRRDDCAVLQKHGLLLLQKTEVLDNNDNGSKAGEKVESGATRLFISYARDDIQNPEHIAAILQKRGYSVFLDKKDILPAEQWPLRLQQMILKCDVFLIFLSEKALSSKQCEIELNLARRLNKKIVPIHLMGMPFETSMLPPDLADIQFLSIENPLNAETDSSSDAFARQVGDAVDIDINWVREHTKISESANAWEAADFDSDYLLRGNELRVAENWKENRPKKAPELTKVQKRFLTESRKFDDQKRADEKRQRDQALVSHSRLLAKLARDENEQSNFVAAANISLEGLASAESALERPFVPECQLELTTALISNRELKVFGSSASICPGGKVAYARKGMNKYETVFNLSTNHEVGRCDDIFPASISDDGSVAVSSSRFEEDSFSIYYPTSDRAHIKAEIPRNIVSRKRGFPPVVSPDGTRIVGVLDSSGGGDGTGLCIWDAANGKLLAEVVVNSTPPIVTPDSRHVILRYYEELEVRQVSDGMPSEGLSGLNGCYGIKGVSYDSRFAAVSVTRFGKEYKLIDTQTGYTHAMIGKGLRDVIFCPNTKFYAVRYDNTVKLFRFADKDFKIEFDGEDEIADMSFSSNSRYFTIGYEYGRVTAWDIEGAHAEISTHLCSNEICKISFVPNSLKIAIKQMNGELVLVDMSKNLEHSIMKFGALGLPEFSAERFQPYFPQSAKAAFLASKTLSALIGKATTSTVETTGKGNSERSRAISSHVERSIVTEKQGVARILDTGNNSTLCDLKGHNTDKAVFWGAISPDGRFASTASADGTARLWNAENGAQIAMLNQGDKEVCFTTFSGDGTLVMTGSDDRSASVWDGRTGAFISQQLHNGHVMDGVFDPTSQLVASVATYQEIRIWRAETGGLVTRITGNDFADFEKFLDVQFSPNSECALVRFKSKTEVGSAVWDIAEGKIMSILAGSGSLMLTAFSPNNRYICGQSRGEKSIGCWDLSLGRKIASYPLYCKPISFFYNSRGDRLAVVGEDEIVIWRTFLTENGFADFAKESIPWFLDGEEREQHFLSPDLPDWIKGSPN